MRALEALNLGELLSALNWTSSSIKWGSGWQKEAGIFYYGFRREAQGVTRSTFIGCVSIYVATPGMGTVQCFSPNGRYELVPKHYTYNQSAWEEYSPVGAPARQWPVLRTSVFVTKALCETKLLAT